MKPETLDVVERLAAGGQWSERASDCGICVERAIQTPGHKDTADAAAAAGGGARRHDTGGGERCWGGGSDVDGDST